MTPTQIIESAKARGVLLYREGEKVRVRFTGSHFDAAARNRLRAIAPSLLPYLPEGIPTQHIDDTIQAEQEQIVTQERESNKPPAPRLRYPYQYPGCVQWVELDSPTPRYQRYKIRFVWGEEVTILFLPMFVSEGRQGPPVQAQKQAAFQIVR